VITGRLAPGKPPFAAAQGLKAVVLDRNEALLTV